MSHLDDSGVQSPIDVVTVGCTSVKQKLVYFLLTLMNERRWVLLQI